MGQRTQDSETNRYLIGIGLIVPAENAIGLRNVELVNAGWLLFFDRARPYINSAQFPCALIVVRPFKKSHLDRFVQDNLNPA
jgi:hypothetical protein